VEDDPTPGDLDWQPGIWDDGNPVPNERLLLTSYIGGIAEPEKIKIYRFSSNHISFFVRRIFFYPCLANPPTTKSGDLE
jgi:hypothetical protein